MMCPDCNSTLTGDNHADNCPYNEKNVVIPRDEIVKKARSAFGMWKDKPCPHHVFEPRDGTVKCFVCGYEPSPEILAASLNALEHIKKALREWPKTALVQFIEREE